METKLAKLKAAFAAGDHIGALQIAARFPQLGEQKEHVTRAWAAVQNPQFYREIDRDPDQLIAAGIAALRERYNLT